MGSIFHQNMRTFGGGSTNRNNAFYGAFNKINNAVGNIFVVAGFTEITNWNDQLRGGLLALAGTLDTGLDSLTVIEVGVTALGTREYAGIAWDSKVVDVQAAGQVSFDHQTETWQPNAVRGTPDTIAMPNVATLAADSRGPAFIAGTYNGSPLIVMFMHNMYGLGDRTRGFNGMPLCGQAIRTVLGGPYEDAEIVAGGDYNVEPRFAGNRRGTEGNLRGLPFRAAVDRYGQYINTTASNPYDFWLGDDADNIPGDWATVRLETRIEEASDHAGIRLRIT